MAAIAPYLRIGKDEPVYHYVKKGRRFRRVHSTRGEVMHVIDDPKYKNADREDIVERIVKALPPHEKWQFPAKIIYAYAPCPYAFYHDPDDDDKRASDTSDFPLRVAALRVRQWFDGVDGKAYLAKFPEGQPDVCVRPAFDEDCVIVYITRKKPPVAPDQSLMRELRRCVSFAVATNQSSVMISHELFPKEVLAPDCTYVHRMMADIGIKDALVSIASDGDWFVHIKWPKPEKSSLDVDPLDLPSDEVETGPIVPDKGAWARKMDESVALCAAEEAEEKELKMAEDELKKLRDRKKTGKWILTPEQFIMEKPVRLKALKRSRKSA